MNLPTVAELLNTLAELDASELAADREGAALIAEALQPFDAMSYLHGGRFDKVAA